ncbi:hypothetical protein ACFQY0_10455 [Haloferula chungangensis]|uniref:Lipoprotein n=1 Tax=Haloferula chungangensis TaxID=1048331 RepID=A0ABW2L785_9BACT
MKKLLFLTIPALVLVSCAGLGSSNTERMLAASGFQPKTPKTQKQTEIYDAMEPYKLYHKEIDGEMVYAYKDPEQGVVYVGGPKENEQYQKYAVEQQIAQDQRVAAEMQMDAAYAWGSWSPYAGAYRRPYY